MKLLDRVGRVLGVHTDVLKLGLVSLLTDISSQMIFSVFAVVFTTIAGASVVLLGLVEGAADFTASSLDYVAGWLSDRSGRRKAFVIAGYGLSTIAKAILVITTTVSGLAFFRVVERIGKSVRGPPRDAWLAMVSDGKSQGFSFGVHKALDRSGAVIGPLLTWAMVAALGESLSTYRLLFMVAFVPAVISVTLLVSIQDQPEAAPRLDSLWQSINLFGTEFRRYIVVAGIFSLGYFSFGFMLLRAHDFGFSVKGIVLLYALFNLSSVLAAPIVGRLGDRFGSSLVIRCGYAVYMLVCLGFIFAKQQWHVIVLFVIYGCFVACDEVQSRAFIASIESQRRGSAIGAYNVVTGCMSFPASAAAGVLWLLYPSATFFTAAVLSFIALVLFSLKPIGPKSLNM
jgi:MFS family permease